MLRISLNRDSTRALVIVKIVRNPRKIVWIDEAAWNLMYANVIIGYVNSDYQYWEY